MLNYKQIWHGIKPIRWLNKFNLTDIVEPFPKATRNRRWLLVAPDYFTKWVKAGPLSNIQDQGMKKLVWKNILTRFGVPQTLISNNGHQFDSKAF